MTFFTTLDRASGELSIEVRASCQPYGVAVGVPHLGNEPEVDILAVTREADGQPVELEAHELKYLVDLAFDHSRQ